LYETADTVKGRRATKRLPAPASLEEGMFLSKRMTDIGTKE
jgi:hypothetical protein